MDSTKPDNSISAGITLPQWMKSKMNDRYDMNEPFSPPSYDDNFYIRYPKSNEAVQTAKVPQQKHFRPISELLEKDPGLSRHTAPCRQFIPQVKMSGNDVPGISLTKPKKSQGVDDGFTGEAALCGKSIVHVAQQMTAAKFTLPNFPDHDASLGAESYDFSKRRGSKSLPVSPLGTPDSSPRTARKHNPNPNRYFTGVFSVAEKPAALEPRYPGGWILSGLMGGQREQLSRTIHEAHEEESLVVKVESDVVEGEKSATLEVPSVAGLRRNKSTPVINQMMTEDKGAGKKTVRPKPSELREMNFWSPTSM